MRAAALAECTVRHLSLDDRVDRAARICRRCSVCVCLNHVPVCKGSQAYVPYLNSGNCYTFSLVFLPGAAAGGRRQGRQGRLRCIPPPPAFEKAVSATLAISN
jgi:hypothetical protein